jgi:hypothetical protein
MCTPCIVARLWNSLRSYISLVAMGKSSQWRTHTLITDLRYNMKRRDELEVLGVVGRYILRWISKKKRVWLCTGFIWLKIGASGGLY